MKPNPLASIKPINEKVAYHMVKDLAMADIATKFIGKSCADNSKPSSTREYEKAWGENANSGVYYSSDIIMISGSGLWRGVSQSMVDEMFESHYIPLIDNAINSNVRGFVCGWANGIDSKVKEYLLSKGYSEIKCQGFSKFKKVQIGIIKVANKKTLTQELGFTDIYIGRPSALGNPYPMSTEHTRKVVCELYHRWLWKQMQIAWREPDTQNSVWNELKRIALLVKSGKNVRLICFCSPAACHGNSIVKAVNWLITEGKV
jgi:hypothetical protein